MVLADIIVVTPYVQTVHRIRIAQVNHNELATVAHVYIVRDGAVYDAVEQSFIVACGRMAGIMVCGRSKIVAFLARCPLKFGSSAITTTSPRPGLLPSWVVIDTLTQLLSTLPVPTLRSL